MTPLHIDTTHNDFEDNHPSEYVPDRSFPMHPRGSRTTRYSEARQSRIYEDEGIPVNSVTPTYSRQVSFTPSAVYVSHQDPFPSNPYNQVSPRYSHGLSTPHTYLHPVSITPTATASASVYAATTPYSRPYRDHDYNPVLPAQSPTAIRSTAHRSSYTEFVNWDGEHVIAPAPRSGTQFPMTTSGEDSVESDECASDEVEGRNRRGGLAVSSSRYGVMEREGGDTRGQGRECEMSRLDRAGQFTSQIPTGTQYPGQPNQSSHYPHPNNPYSYHPPTQSQLQSQSQSQLQGERDWEDREPPIRFDEAFLPACSQPSLMTNRSTLVSLIPESNGYSGAQSQVEETALPTLSRLEIPTDTVYHPPLIYQEDLLDDDEEDYDYYDYDYDYDENDEGYGGKKGMLPVIIEDPVPKGSSYPFYQTASASPHAHSLTTTPRALQRYACESDSYGCSPHAVRDGGWGSFAVDYHGRSSSQHRLNYLNVSPRVARISPSPRHSRPTPLPTIFPATSSSLSSTAVTPSALPYSKGVSISRLPLWTAMPYRAIWEEEDELAARARQSTPRASALDRVISILGNGSSSNSSGEGATSGTNRSSYGHSSQQSVVRISSHSDGSSGTEFHESDSRKGSRSRDGLKDRIERAIHAKRSCHLRQARTLFLSLVVDAPLEIQVWCEFIRMEMESGDYMNARTVLKSALQVLPDDEILLQKSLRIEERLGDVHALLRVVGELCRIGSPKSAKTMMEGVMSLARLGYEKTAMEYYLLITHNPRYSTGNFFMAYILFLAQTTDQQTLWNTLPEMLSRFPKYGPLWFFALDLLQHDCFIQWDCDDVLFDYGEFERVGKTALNTLTSDIMWKVYFMRVQLWSRLLLQLYHMDYPKVGDEWMNE